MYTKEQWQKDYKDIIDAIVVWEHQITPSAKVDDQDYANAQVFLDNVIDYAKEYSKADEQ